MQNSRVPVATGTANFDNGRFDRYSITTVRTVGGVDVGVSVQTDINGTPGALTAIGSASLVGGDAANLNDYRYQIGARTGGLDFNADIDNVQTSIGSLAATATTAANFEDGGAGQTGFVGYRLGAGDGPAFVETGGPQGTAVRLIHNNQGSQRNTVVFDQAQDGTNTGLRNVDGFLISFDFAADGGPTPADGFSTRILPTATYGTENFGTDGNGAEEPNFPGVLAFGFDYFGNGGDVHASIHLNGERTFLAISPGTLNLNDGMFHSVNISGVEDGADILIDFTIDGLTVADDFRVTGYSLTDSRLEFAGRSGGSTMTVDLDNVAFGLVPEPSIVSLALLGLAGCLLRRQRA